MEREEVENSLGRKELIELYSHFRTVGKEELNLLYQYLNFYVGLLSAILAATLAGILNSQGLAGNVRELYLLVGPLLILALSLVGNSTVNVFYHRFVQAWVTTANIETMLRLSSDGPFRTNVAAPPYPSKYGSFIPQVESPAIKQVFDQGKVESWSAEEVVKRLVEIGITRRNAKMTFISFGIVGCLIAFAIVADVILL
jgi:hypothetical protein